MSTTLFLAFLTFLSVARMAESICCDEIKSEVKKKIHAYKTLCSNDTRLSANCCKEIEEEVNDYRQAYNDLCTGNGCGKSSYIKTIMLLNKNDVSAKIVDHQNLNDSYLWNEIVLNL
jgi:hypothetical protein